MTTRTRYALKATTINGVSPIHGSTEYPLPVENADGNISGNITFGFIAMGPVA